MPIPLGFMRGFTLLLLRIIEGKWKMENGKWKVENGKWKAENGKRKMENEK